MDSFDYRSFLLAAFEIYKDIFCNECDDGTILIGKAPHIAPLAIIVEIFPPLSEQEVCMLAEQARREIPEELIHMYRQLNGVHLFVNLLSISGLRTSYDRSGKRRMPFSVEDKNVFELPRNATDDMFFFGSYGEDSYIVYATMKSSEIFYCKVDDATPLFSWPTLKDFFTDEISRLLSLHNEDGVLLSDNMQDTLPIAHT